MLYVEMLRYVVDVEGVIDVVVVRGCYVEVVIDVVVV